MLDKQLTKTGFCGRQTSHQDNLHSGNALFLQITWADIEFLWFAQLPKMLGVDVSLDKFEKLNALAKKVESHPKVVEWNNKKLNK